MSELIHQLIESSAQTAAARVALIHKDQHWSYGQLASLINDFCHGLLNLSLSPGARIAVYLPKQLETVVALFGASKAGGVMVPINPVLKPAQVKHILDDCTAEFLVTSHARYQQLKATLNDCAALKTIILVDGDTEDNNTLSWQALSSVPQSPHRRIDRDIAALLYTSGSTGKPKGVVLSHANLVAGAKSVSEYLHNHKDDRLLAVLPLSFDYGLSQLTTAFLTGASVVLLEYLLPKDVIKAVEKYQITGLAAVPPLWIQLAELDWPEEAKVLRYITNSGGVMPQQTLSRLREQLPNTQPYLMYGLTEAFRSTYLEPTELDRRPTSIGKAIPNAEILVLREDGTPCAPNEPGELVHRGAHVSLGYWNDPEKTRERFRPLPPSHLGHPGEIAVWSGDTVVQDEEGFLYFVGRKDDMIKSSGYRISPAEIEEVVFALPEVAEIAAIGAPHPQLGQAIVLAIKPAYAEVTSEHILQFCKQQLPNFMQPKHIEFYHELPRNANGKIDRPKLAAEHQFRFQPQANVMKHQAEPQNTERHNTKPQGNIESNHSSNSNS
jgi:acyl-CoA ligase (AMP-forming) (exosortase A-associated)